MKKDRTEKNKRKMNALYKIAFILIIICAALLAAGAVSYAFEESELSELLTGSGVLLALIGIILTLLSSPKKPKKPKKSKKSEKISAEEVDSKEEI